MTHRETYISSDDNIQLFVSQWQPAAPPTAVMQIVHGMAEHCLRYTPLAEFLNRHGIAVVAHDQRGFGKTAASGIPGLFSANNGWQKVLDDVDRVRDFIDQTYSDLPVIVLGHSMGSFVVQAYTMTRRGSLAGCVLSGSNLSVVSLLRLLRLVARFERWRAGPGARSKIIDYLSFGAFNKRFKPNRTAFDWLSRDHKQVDLYISDPLCGQLNTNQLWIDLLDGLIYITQPQNQAKIPPDLPIFIIGGEMDPVSYDNRLPELATALGKAGAKKVDCTVYPDCRHEIFNEINRQQVFDDLLEWIQLNALRPSVWPPPSLPAVDL